MKRYALLREELKIKGIDQKAIGERFGMTNAAISAKFTGKAPWTIEEAYIVCCEMLGFDARMLPHLFPQRDAPLIRRETKNSPVLRA